MLVAPGLLTSCRRLHLTRSLGPLLGSRCGSHSAGDTEASGGGVTQSAELCGGPALGEGQRCRRGQRRNRPHRHCRLGPGSHGDWGLGAGPGRHPGWGCLPPGAAGRGWGHFAARADSPRSLGPDQCPHRAGASISLGLGRPRRKQRDWPDICAQRDGVQLVWHSVAQTAPVQQPL